MIKLSDFETKCNWNREIVCKNGKLCNSCEHQPPDDEKENGRKPPLKIGWSEEYGGVWPVCPACGEMPYSTERCVFCGQRFIQEDEQLQEYNKPMPEERRDCLMCGGKATVIGRRARGNGHFHGECERCGARVME